ncbi:hypothetical protein QAD02_024164 [Eretmocerus hayati]|uniref:Uncharacterized protein n=1 Tax=Eretmocerus hayati TaxID=131215 RepID=A0ACC2Q0H2_9HYME|nr:hypothetical protein QAD02_024164 [Eretmocerus hayati]
MPWPLTAKNSGLLYSLLRIHSLPFKRVQRRSGKATYETSKEVAYQTGNEYGSALEETVEEKYKNIAHNDGKNSEIVSNDLEGNENVKVSVKEDSRENVITRHGRKTRKPDRLPYS